MSDVSAEVVQGPPSRGGVEVGRISEDAAHLPVANLLSKRRVRDGARAVAWAGERGYLTGARGRG